MMEHVMKMYLSSITAGLLLLGCVGLATAQDVVIAPEQETVIREYVQKKPIASIDLPGVELNIGSTLPETVELHEVDVPDVKYRYVVVGGQTVLVEPETRKIVHIMQ
jgi:PBP1b-binding outer membrane lipoprotein LpoB